MLSHRARLEPGLTASLAASSAPLAMSGCRVFIGRLNPAAREKDVERFFKGYGRIRDIDLKRGFGFVVSAPGPWPLLPRRGVSRRHVVCERLRGAEFLVSTKLLRVPVLQHLCIPCLLRWVCRNSRIREMQTMLSMSWMEKSFAVRGELPHLTRCFQPTRFMSCVYELWFFSSTVKARCRLFPQ